MAERSKKPSDEELSWDDTVLEQEEFSGKNGRATNGRALENALNILARGSDEQIPWGSTAVGMSPQTLSNSDRRDCQLTFREGANSYPTPPETDITKEVPPFFYDDAKALEFCHIEISKILVRLSSLNLLEGLQGAHKLPWKLWGQIVQATENRLCDIAHDCAMQFGEAPPRLRPYLERGPREFCDPKKAGKISFSINDLPALLQAIEETLSFLCVKSAESKMQEPTPQSAQARFKEAIRRFFGFESTQ